MSYMVDVIDLRTQEVLKTLGPMSERKAERVERGLLINLDDDNYYVRTVQVTNDIEHTD